MCRQMLAAIATALKSPISRTIGDVGIEVLILMLAGQDNRGKRQTGGQSDRMD
jgi:hypothetical protein